MKKLIVVLAFAFTLCSLRLADSILTRRLLAAAGNGVKELNPFINTESVLKVFLSPVPVMIGLIAVALFLWMVVRPERTLAAYEDAGASVSSILVKGILGGPLLIIVLLTVAVMQNSFIFFHGESLWPAAIRTWKIDNPVLALATLALVLEVCLGGFLRRTMVSILRQVSERAG
jgi:hypothetical protein